MAKFKTKRHSEEASRRAKKSPRKIGRYSRRSKPARALHPLSLHSRKQAPLLLRPSLKQHQTNLCFLSWQLMPQLLIWLRSPIKVRCRWHPHPAPKPILQIKCTPFALCSTLMISKQPWASLRRPIYKPSKCTTSTSFSCDSNSERCTPLLRRTWQLWSRIDSIQHQERQGVR